MEHLTEPGVRNHLLTTLEECKYHKFSYYTTIVNLILLGVFILLVAIILYFKKKGKLTEAERKKKNEDDRTHIINRIRSLQLEKISTYKMV
jgi:hypothetical protein